MPEEYRRRSIVESMHSAIRGRSSSFVISRDPQLAEKEIALKKIAYNTARMIAISNSTSIFIILGFLGIEFYQKAN